MLGALVGLGAPGGGLAYALRAVAEAVTGRVALVLCRLERQQRLRSAGGPLIWAILNEAVIRRQVGDKETIGRQL
ncbi:MAG: Scr1 family TA system antitoxin-like transcriptional regulator [Pseudonocardiaceae bacterium]